MSTAAARPAFSRDALDSIRRVIDMRRMALELPGVKAAVRGDAPVAARCLWHEERTPSMAVYRDHFYCFGCAATGDVFRWLERVQGLRFPEAVRMAGHMAGIDPDASGEQRGASRALRYPKDEIAFWLDALPEAERGRMDVLDWNRLCREWASVWSHDDHRRYLKYKEFVGAVDEALEPIEDFADEDSRPAERKRDTGTVKDRGIGTPVATYSYEDSDGRPLYEIIRLVRPDGSKTFTQRLPGAQENGIGQVERVPYRLPRVLQARTVFLVEGEKDVHTLEAWGLVASCNPGGAGSGRLYRKWQKYFDGRNVVILPDNDAPGKSHARTVASSLYQCGPMKIVILPGLPHKGDVSDWVQAGGTFERFRKIVKETAPVSALLASRKERHEVR